METDALFEKKQIVLLMRSKLLKFPLMGLVLILMSLTMQLIALSFEPWTCCIIVIFVLRGVILDVAYLILFVLRRYVLQ